MRAVLPLLIGCAIGAALAQWYILLTREPTYVLCDGGEEGRPDLSPTMTWTMRRDGTWLVKN